MANDDAEEQQLYWALEFQDPSTKEVHVRVALYYRPDTKTSTGLIWRWSWVENWLGMPTHEYVDGFPTKGRAVSSLLARLRDSNREDLADVVRAHERNT